VDIGGWIIRTVLAWRLKVTVNTVLLYVLPPDPDG
jgi:hypothetical protein